MPYKREGAVKVSDHWVRSPMLNISRACQVCHQYPEQEIQARVDAIQNRTNVLMQRSGKALVGMLDAIKNAQANGASEQDLAAALELQRKAQWRLDFVARRIRWVFMRPQKRHAFSPSRSTTLARPSSSPKAWVRRRRLLRSFSTCGASFARRRTAT